MGECGAVLYRAVSGRWLEKGCVSASVYRLRLNPEYSRYHRAESSRLTHLLHPVAIVMILMMLSLRTHRKKPYPCDEEENVHENIVRYDDEGGGEEDT